MCSNICILIFASFYAHFQPTFFLLISFFFFFFFLLEYFQSQTYWKVICGFRRGRKGGRKKRKRNVKPLFLTMKWLNSFQYCSRSKNDSSHDLVVSVFDTIVAIFSLFFNTFSLFFSFFLPSSSNDVLFLFQYSFYRWLFNIKFYKNSIITMWRRIATSRYGIWCNTRRTNQLIFILQSSVGWTTKCTVSLSLLLFLFSNINLNVSTIQEVCKKSPERLYREIELNAFFLPEQ